MKRTLTHPRPKHKLMLNQAVGTDVSNRGSGPGAHIPALGETHSKEITLHERQEPADPVGSGQGHTARSQAPGSTPLHSCSPQQLFALAVNSPLCKANAILPSAYTAQCHAFLHTKASIMTEPLPFAFHWHYHDFYKRLL